MTDFERDGYVVLRGFWPAHLLKEWEIEVTAAYLRQCRKAGGQAANLEEALLWFEKHDQAAGYQVLRTLELSTVGRSLGVLPDLMFTAKALLDCDYIDAVLGPHPFVNLPNTKRLLYRWHVEAHYYPKRLNFLNVWFPIFHEKHEGNGTMWMCPGSHAVEGRPFAEYQGYDEETVGKRRHFVQYEIPEAHLTQYEKVPIVASPGDVVIFHRNMVHTSTQNPSERVSLASVMRIFDYSHDLTLAGEPSVQPYAGRDHARPGMTV